MILGIMQGRLVPPEGNSIQAFPRERWAEEFPRAAEAGLQAIEWIFDEWGRGANPLESDEGIQQIRELSARHGVAVRSVCADLFMERPLLAGSESERSERRSALRDLIGRAERLGVGRIVLPFVDRSSLRTEKEQSEAAETLASVLDSAESRRVELHLETDLPPEGFRGLLERLPHPLVKVNYDSGNSASLGYRPEEELAAYGDRLGSVHVKDRRLHGGTVPLGTGDADLPGLFRLLADRGYSGDFVLQAARGCEGDEVGWARLNRERVELLWSEAQRGIAWISG